MQGLNEICEIISVLKQPKEIEKFLSEILTDNELKDVIDRWDILKMLSKNESQRSISKKLSVSLCKITRGSKILKNNKSITKKILFDENWRSLLR